MGILGLNTGKDNIFFGTQSDVCYFCVKDKVLENRVGFSEGARKLKGMLEGKKVLKFPAGGQQVVICMNHLHKFSDDNKEHAQKGENHDE